MKKYDQIEFLDEIKKKINNPEIIIKLKNGLAVKFHKRPLLEVAKIQKNTGVI